MKIYDVHNFPEGITKPDSIINELYPTQEISAQQKTYFYECKLRYKHNEELKKDEKLYSCDNRNTQKKKH